MRILTIGCDNSSESFRSGPALESRFARQSGPIGSLLLASALLATPAAARTCRRPNSMPEPHASYSLRRWKPVEVDDLVRVGKNNDGGYVISQRCLDATKTLIGLGIRDDWSFEEAFAARTPGVEVVGVDGSVSHERFLVRAAEAATRSLVALTKLKRYEFKCRLRDSLKWVGKGRAFRRFFESTDKHRFYEKFLTEADGRHSMTWTTLRAAHTPVQPLGIFVKMDIELSEYRVLPHLVNDADDINGLVVEFHDCDLLWARFEELMDRLCGPFAVVHIHGNNFSPLIPGSSCPQVLEVSFVNRRLLPTDVRESSREYPLPGLDQPCSRRREEYRIQFD